MMTQDDLNAALHIAAQSRASDIIYPSRVHVLCDQIGLLVEEVRALGRAACVHNENEAIQQSDIDRLRELAKAVIDQQRLIHDTKPWPQKYTAAFGAIAALAEYMYPDPARDPVNQPENQ